MKEIKKLSLSNVISKLTRNEMRYVMAGSGSAGSCVDTSSCPSGEICCADRPGVKAYCQPCTCGHKC